MQELRQSTAATLLLGPFLDETDGKTAETALTIAQADVRLSKNGGNMAQKSEATSCTHDELGYYGCPVNTTDTNTLGRLKVMVHESGALPVWETYMVVTQQYWDSKYSIDRLQVDVREFGDSGLALTTQMKADVDAECDVALTNYDPPTNTEMEARTLEAASYFDPAADTVTLADAGLTAAKIAMDAIGSSELAASAATEIADAVLGRGVSNIEDTADTASLAAVILAMLESSISGTAWTIRKTGGTVFVIKTLTVDSGADPITGVT